jgi:hypothetical protein
MILLCYFLGDLVAPDFETARPGRPFVTELQGGIPPGLNQAVAPPMANV